MIKKTVGIFLAVMVSLSAVTSASAQGPLDAMDEALIEFGLPEEKIDNLPPALAEELYNMALQGYKLDSITTTYTYGMRNAAGSPDEIGIQTMYPPDMEMDIFVVDVAESDITYPGTVEKLIIATWKMNFQPLITGTDLIGVAWDRDWEFIDGTFRSYYYGSDYSGNWYLLSQDTYPAKAEPGQGFGFEIDIVKNTFHPEVPTGWLQVNHHMGWIEARICHEIPDQPLPSNAVSKYFHQELDITGATLEFNRKGEPTVSLDSMFGYDESYAGTASWVVYPPRSE